MKHMINHFNTRDKLRSLFSFFERLCHSDTNPSSFSLERIELSSIDQCNGRCRYCYLWKGKRKALELKHITDFLISVQELTTQDTIIDLTGGEATLRKDLPEIIQTCVTSGLIPNLVTNGYRLADKNYAKQLCDSGLRHVAISLDGFQKSNDYLRGNGSYEKVIRALENLAEQHVHVVTTSVITSKNINELNDLIDWLEEKRYINGYNLQILTNYFGRYRDKEEWYKKSELWPKDTRAIDTFTKQLQTGLEKRKTIPSISASQVQFWNTYLKDPGSFKKKSDIECTIGNKFISFTPYGKIKFCHVLDSVGSIINNDIKTILCSRMSQRRRKQIKKCNKTCNYILNCQYRLLVEG